VGLVSTRLEGSATGEENISAVFTQPTGQHTTRETKHAQSYSEVNIFASQIQGALRCGEQRPERRLLGAVRTGPGRRHPQ